jgi:positive regulator of sigma E activity
METGVPISVEQRINIFQTAYKESVKCKSSQPCGFGYMAKLPTKSEMIKFEVEEQARATQKVNSELIQQVTQLEQKLQDERDSMDEKINF